MTTKKEQIKRPEKRREYLQLFQISWTIKILERYAWLESHIQPIEKFVIKKI